MSLPGYKVSLPCTMLNQGIYDTCSTTAKHIVGDYFYGTMGRVYYYGKASTTIAAGEWVASDSSAGGPWATQVDGACVAITAANRRLGNTNVAITAALTAGDFGVGVTHASYLDGIVAGQLAGGLLFLHDTGTTDHNYVIADNTAHSGVTADVVEILLEDPIAVTTVDATCSVCVMQHPFTELALADSTVDEGIVGVATMAMTDGQFGWIQSWGPGTVKTATDTAFAGTMLAMSTTAGACEQGDTDNIEAYVGYCFADVASASDACAAMIQCIA